MGTARYIGRVGGLAVAFGVGTAVLTGYGVASADSTSSGSDSGSSSQGSSAGSGSSSSAGSTSGTQDSTGSQASPSSASSDGVDADADDADDPNDSDDIGAVDAVDEPGVSDDSAFSDSESSDPAIDVEEDAAEPSGAAVGSRDSGTQFGNASDVGAVIAAEAVVEDQSQALEWLSSPEVVAGRAPVDATPTGPAPVSVPTILPVVESATVESAAVASPVLDLVDDVLNPFAGDGPIAPPTGSPLEWAAAAAVRREALGGLFTNPITVNPTLGFTDGVIVGGTGAVNANGNALKYTITSGPDNGKAFVNPTPADPATDPYAADVAGQVTYLPDSSLLVSRGTDQFTVMVSELSDLMTFLTNVPLLGEFVQPIVLGLQKTRFLGDLLQPIIGYRTFVTFDVNIDELVPLDTPVAFTTMVTSYDGVQISTNYFPASGLGSGETATTVLNGPGLGASGNIDAHSVWTIKGLTPGVKTMREAGYNYVSWDPRGEHASGGFLQLDNPFYEGRDVQHIIDYVATLPETQLDELGDPTMGMIGGSYGGGIQLVTAGIDDRIEAIVPGIAWNSLNDALYPANAFKSSWGEVLGLALLGTGARINSQIYPALIEGSVFGFLNESQQAILASSGPTVLVESITAPTLLLQGTVDGLFPLEQASINAELLNANDIPVDMVWYCGGHGVCLDPVAPVLGAGPGIYTAQGALNMDKTMKWLDKYVNGNELVPTGPRFQWWDQNGEKHESNLLPTEPAFYGDPLVTLGGGGPMLLNPIFGGSGPQTKPPTPKLVAAGLAAPARIAINTSIPAQGFAGDVVGAPELTFTYSGLGTSRHIYAQLVDDQTNLVLGNIITPVPVDLDGRSHTVTVDLAQIAYTMEPGDSLTLQLVGSTSVYTDTFQWGFIDIEGIEIALPTVAGQRMPPLEAADDVSAA